MPRTGLNYARRRTARDSSMNARLVTAAGWWPTALVVREEMESVPSRSFTGRGENQIFGHAAMDFQATRPSPESQKLNRIKLRDLLFLHSNAILFPGLKL